MPSTDDYVALVTSEHADKPNFIAAIRAMTQGFVDAQNAALGLPEDFDLDTAIGAQLDAVALWVGVGRQVAVPLTGVYFTWDDTAADGWNSGVWQGAFDPSSGLTTLNDDSFRTLLRAKIAANHWDGTIAGLYACYAYVFGAGIIQVQDGMDMTVTIIYDNTKLSAVQIALLTGGYFKLKPDGVKVNYASASAPPTFAWDMNLPKYQGWTGTSVWA